MWHAALGEKLELPGRERISPVGRLRDSYSTRNELGLRHSGHEVTTRRPVAPLEAGIGSGFTLLELLDRFAFAQEESGRRP